MGNEVRKQQVVRHAATNEASLPLFDRLGKKETSPESEPEAHHAETPHKPKESSRAPSIPVPVFLAGKKTGKNNFAEERVETESFNRQEPIEGPSNKTSGAQAKETSEPLIDNVPEPNDEDMTTSESPEPIPPARNDISIWPWLVVILLIISGAGFWYKQDAWLDHPWVRSVLINLHLPITVRDKDWVIVPESVQGNWLKRDDGSQVLIIQGRIENHLYCELSPPKILVRFFDESGISEPLEERVMPITEPPSMEKVKHAPFVAPGLDLVAVEAQGQRGFFLVLESLPERTADFTLNPIAN